MSELFFAEQFLWINDGYGLDWLKSLDAVEALGAAEGVPLRLSVSVGVAMAQPDDDEDSLLRRADHAMYSRKHGLRAARAR